MIGQEVIHSPPIYPSNNIMPASASAYTILSSKDNPCLFLCAFTDHARPAAILRSYSIGRAHVFPTDRPQQAPISQCGRVYPAALIITQSAAPLQFCNTIGQNTRGFPLYKYGILSRRDETMGASRFCLEIFVDMHAFRRRGGSESGETGTGTRVSG
ncbi:hypothetical protein BU26DRAFT_213494 [Trematosphaeria pertusa]|uniref:Uncharacterized protein n=1 Tax=Trematosphaeria pertusa TaxID=390896 RepID=A0A6A6ISF6_9PLEO|nr:uncharacterized protein BU26DRAFT_213494 [Trematosphaeria pertusa]KAF2253028.1 hypothetical protein BU26DRAFT_213494 [Trematosphaeria pertusa]